MNVKEQCRNIIEDSLENSLIIIFYSWLLKLCCVMLLLGASPSSPRGGEAAKQHQRIRMLTLSSFANQESHLDPLHGLSNSSPKRDFVYEIVSNLSLDDSKNGA